MPFIGHRSLCLPVLARLWLPRRPDQTKQLLARELLSLITAQHPDRVVHVIADAAYAGKTMRALPVQVTITARLRADAALYQLPPPPPAARAARVARASVSPS